MLRPLRQPQNSRDLERAGKSTKLGGLHSDSPIRVRFGLSGQTSHPDYPFAEGARMKRVMLYCGRTDGYHSWTYEQSQLGRGQP